MDTIKQTNDYSIFKRIAGNRAVNHLHVKRLKESMVQSDLKIPIIVNEHNEVIDGQHRLQARTELKIPVFYIVIKGLGIHETQRANASNKNWKADDFLNTYCELNYFHYKVYKDFKKRFQFGHQELCALLCQNTGGEKMVSEFRSGNFVTNNLEHATEVAENIMQVEQYYPGYKRRGFVLAIIKLTRNEDFVFEEFINKLSFQSMKMVDCTTVDLYIKCIENIYNFQRKADKKVRFI